MKTDTAMDLGFIKENRWFRYQAGAIIVEDGCVLFAGNKEKDYYYSIGGAVKHGETAQEAVCREVFEETGIPYEVDRLAVIHENFFYETIDGNPDTECHEICFYFLMKPKRNQDLNSNSYTKGIRESMHWLLLAEFEKYHAYPSFMKDYLSQEHEGIVHIITDDRPAQRKRKSSRKTKAELNNKRLTSKFTPDPHPQIMPVRIFSLPVCRQKPDEFWLKSKKMSA